MENPIAGVTPIMLGGHEYRLQYNWNAIAAISKKFGDHTNLFDPATLSEVVAIGLHKYHPNMTADDVANASPPIIEAIAAVNTALQYAYFGDKGPPADGEENPLAMTLPASPKPSPKASRGRSKSVSEPASTPTSSGG